MSKRRVFVVGVGMTKFEKPGKRDWDYPQMGKVATLNALKDSGVDFSAIEQAVVGYVYGDSTCGQRAVYEVGLTGIPVTNVNNNCSTGSTALFMAKQLVQGGLNDCILALGFEKMERGSLSSKFTDRTNPMDQHITSMMDKRGYGKGPPAAQLFGNAGVEHMERYGTKKSTFAKIAEKNHRHSAKNPYSQFRDVYSLEQIEKSPAVFAMLTKLQCCPTSDGAAAAIVCSEDFVHKHHLEGQAVEIIGMSMATDMKSSFEADSIKTVGFDMSKLAAEKAFKEAGVRADDCQVVELHDCFSANELITYEALGLCKEGEAEKFVESGNNTYGGKYVVNPSGGLISKGHPLGATGLAQCAELCWQLRGMAGDRQVKNCKIGLQHNIGLGGAAVVGVYKLAFPEVWKAYPSGKWNPAIELSPEEPSAKGLSSSAVSAKASSSAKSKFGAVAILNDLGAAMKEDPDLVKQINGTYLYVITKSGDKIEYTVDLKTGPVGTVKQGSHGDVNCTIELDDQDFVDLFTGETTAQNLFMSGQLKISGDMAYAMKMSQILESKRKAGATLVNSKTEGGSVTTAGGSKFRAAMVFDELSKRIGQDSSLVKKIQAVYKFVLKKGDETRSWVVDLKNGSGQVSEGSSDADCTITMSDDDFTALMTGKLNAQQAFMQGKLKIAGNMSLAMKLGQLTKAKSAL